VSRHFFVPDANIPYKVNDLRHFSMKHSILSPIDLARVIRAVRKSVKVRQDDLAGAVGVSRQFAVDVEKGKPTVQLGKVLQLLDELGVVLSVDLPEEASRIYEQLRQGSPATPRPKKTVRSPSA
jgi:y4mF family transcriptional regulator